MGELGLAYYELRRRVSEGFAGETHLTHQDVGWLLDGLRARYRQIGKHGEGPSFLTAYLPVLDQVGQRVGGKGCTLRELMDRVVWSIAERFCPGSTLLGEKTPAHTLHWRWLKALYPDVPVFLVIRNPVDNIASIARRRGSFEVAFRRYRHFSECIREMSQSGDCNVIRYEELLESPKRMISEFLARFPGDRALDPEFPLNAYVKGAYTGASLDPSRARRAREDLSQGQVLEVHSRLDWMLRMWYPDEADG
jgi:hypothetical protein